MRNEEVRTKKELFEQKSEGDEKAGSDADQTHDTKKMKGPGYVMNQELDGDQIEQNAKGASEPIVGFSLFAEDVRDRDLGDLGAFPARQRRNKAMEFAIEANLLKDLPAVGLESAPEVVDGHPRKLGHEPVRRAGRNAPGQAVATL